MIRVPDYMRDPERYLWGMIVIVLVVIASTDPWFQWKWWLLGAGVGVMSFFVGYLTGKHSGWARGYSQGYRVCMNERRRR